MYGSHDGIRFFISKIQQNLNVDKTNLYFLMKMALKKPLWFQETISLLFTWSHYYLFQKKNLNCQDTHFLFFWKAHFFHEIVSLNGSLCIEGVPGSYSCIMLDQRKRGLIYNFKVL